MKQSFTDLKNIKFKRNFKLFLIVSTLILSLTLLINLEPPKENKLKAQSEEYSQTNTNSLASSIPFDFINKEIKELEMQKIEEMKAIELKTKVEKVESIFQKYGGYMNGYGELIVKRAEECGGDYKIIVAIAGNESGFGRINYKLYNPFGYLDGVQYASYEDALYTITCKISQRFIVPCNQDLVCIINKYGGSDTDKEKWVRNVQSFMNQL